MKKILLIGLLLIVLIGCIHNKEESLKDENIPKDYDIILPSLTTVTTIAIDEKISFGLKDSNEIKNINSQ